MQTSGGLYVWDFERRGRKINVRVDGPLVFNTSPPQVEAALAGLGVALLPEDEVMSHVEAGRLVRVLEDWCPKFDPRIDAAAVEFQMPLFEPVAKPEQRKPWLTKTPRDGPGRSARQHFNVCRARVGDGAGDELAPHLAVFRLRVRVIMHC